MGKLWQTICASFLGCGHVTVDYGQFVHFSSIHAAVKPRDRVTASRSLRDETVLIRGHLTAVCLNKPLPPWTALSLLFVSQLELENRAPRLVGNQSDLYGFLRAYLSSPAPLVSYPSVLVSFVATLLNHPFGSFSPLSFVIVLRTSFVFVLQPPSNWPVQFRVFVNSCSLNVFYPVPHYAYRYTFFILIVCTFSILIQILFT